MYIYIFFYFFLIAEDSIDITIDTNNSQSEAGSDQPSHISDWWVSAPIHQRTAEEFRGCPRAPLAWSCPARSVDAPRRYCWAGRADPSAEVERWERGAQVCLLPPCPAASPAPERWQRVRLFLPRWLCLFVLQGHTLRAAQSWVLQPRRSSKRVLCPVQWNMLFLAQHPAPSLAPAGTLGDVTPCCAVLTYWPGTPTPWAFQSCSMETVTPGQTSCWLSVCPLLSGWIHGPEGLNLPL